MAQHPPNPPGAMRAAVLAYVRECIEAGAPSPTIREICNAVGISSTSVVAYHLNRLARDGEVRRIPSISRGLILADAAPVDRVTVGADVIVVIDGAEVVAPYVRLATAA